MGTKVAVETMAEIRLAGIEALVRQLGVVGTIRFLQYENKGYGDYSQDRHHWLGNPDLNQIADEIEKMRK